MNPAKTEDGKYVTCYACQPETTKSEFILSKRIYEDITGRTRDKNVLLYQIRQSFKPGEITPEQAHKIAYELAMSFTKGWTYVNNLDIKSRTILSCFS
ncbi:MAG: relaxase/mobilization nuclease domain-containing protein [Oscillospiraceae bacterium]